jgi:hypothetical protein
VKCTNLNAPCVIEMLDGQVGRDLCF